MRKNQRRYEFKQAALWVRSKEPLFLAASHSPTPAAVMEHDVFRPSGRVDPSTTSPGFCIGPSPSISEPSSSKRANRRRSNRMATKAFYDNLTASAHDGQDEQVWAPSDMSDAAVGLFALVPTSPSASPCALHVVYNISRIEEW